MERPNAVKHETVNLEIREPSIINLPGKSVGIVGFNHNDFTPKMVNAFYDDGQALFGADEIDAVVFDSVSRSMSQRVIDALPYEDDALKASDSSFDSFVSDFLKSHGSWLLPFDIRNDIRAAGEEFNAVVKTDDSRGRFITYRDDPMMFNDWIKNEQDHQIQQLKESNLPFFLEYSFYETCSKNPEMLTFLAGATSFSALYTIVLETFERFGGYRGISRRDFLMIVGSTATGLTTSLLFHLTGSYSPPTKDLKDNIQSFGNEKMRELLRRYHISDEELARKIKEKNKNFEQRILGSGSITDAIRQQDQFKWRASWNDSTAERVWANSILVNAVIAELIAETPADKLVPPDSNQTADEKPKNILIALGTDHLITNQHILSELLLDSFLRRYTVWRFFNVIISEIKQTFGSKDRQKAVKALQGLKRTFIDVPFQAIRFYKKGDSKSQVETGPDFHNTYISETVADEVNRAIEEIS